MATASPAPRPEFEPLQAVVGAGALLDALKAKAELGGSLALNLVRVGVLDETYFVRHHARDGLWREAEPGLIEACDASTARLVPPEIVSGFGMIPLQVDAAGSLLVGVLEPLQRPRIDEAEFFAGMTVVPRLVRWSLFHEAFTRVAGRAMCELPAHPALDSAATNEACLQHVAFIESLADDWVRSYREPPSSSPPAPPRDEVDDRIIRVERAHSPVLPTPVEPAEAVAAAARRSNHIPDRPAAPFSAQTEFSEDSPSARSAASAPQRTGITSDGIYGPAPSVVDRMGHPSPFVRAVVRNMLRSFQETTTTDELMLELAEGLGLVYPNAVVLSVRAGQLHVWQASLYRGPREILARRFDYESVEPWDRVIAEGIAFRGRLSPKDPLRLLLGRDLSRDTLLFPIAIRGRAVAVVVLDAGYEGELTPAGGQYEAVEGGINDALVRILRTRRMVGDAV